MIDACFIDKSPVFSGSSHPGRFPDDAQFCVDWRARLHKNGISVDQ
jgi:hypothetical protein